MIPNSTNLTGNAYRWQFCLAQLGIILFGLALSHRFYFWDFDDGFIVYRIVENLIHHGEWSYNLGQIHNASTSVLNTLLIASIGWLVGDVRIAAHIIGSASLIISGVLILSLFWKRVGSVLALFGSSIAIYSIAYGYTWGIEAHLFAFLFLLFLWFEDQKRNSWFIIGLLILTRPDALVLFVFKVIQSWLVTKKFPTLGIFQTLIILAPWIIFSLTTFKQIFPDTLSAKVWQGRSGYWGSGLIYLKALFKHLFVDDYIKTGLFVFALAGIISWLKSQSVFLYLLFFALTQQIIYIILNVPGYHWYFFSLDLVSYLLLISSLAWLGIYLPKKLTNNKMISRSIFLVIFLTLISFSYKQIYSDNFAKDLRNESYKKAIVFLEKQESSSPGSLATLEVGTIGYGTKRPIVDLVGLASNNPEYITGANLDKYFRNPAELVLLHNPLWHFERSLYDDLRFRILYKFKNNIDDPFFGMQYFALTDASKKLTSSEVENFIKINYQPYLLQKNFIIADPSIDAVCILDQINGQLVREPEVTISKNVLRLSGWAADQKNINTPPLSLFLRFIDSGDLFSFPAKRLRRSDVAKHLGNDGYEMSGYEGEGSILDLPFGKYEIWLSQEGEAKSQLNCKIATNIYLK